MFGRFASRSFRCHIPWFLLATSLTRSRAAPVTLQSSSSAAVMCSSGATKPAFGWCCTASVEQASGKEPEITVDQVFGDAHQDKNPFRSVKGDKNENKRLDLTSSPDWMEFLERTEGRLGEKGGAGAYDALRCDLVLRTPQQDDKNTKDCWNIWGEDFHLRRLVNSYSSVLTDGDDEHHEDHHQIALGETVVQRALASSRALLRALLAQAEGSDILSKAPSFMDGCASPTFQDVEIQVVRLTLLWSPPHSSDARQDHIIVRGHACCSTKRLQVHRPVDPITVSLAALGHNHDHITVDESMPTRRRDPQHKVASWTRLRKEMESPHTYKPPGVSEVLMVRPAKDSNDLEVLEGLSSNLFAVYKDGTIRTASDGVLFGYVRRLVLECAETCGLTLDPRPILLHESDEWQEAFITSSSRLIFPIGRIVVHNDEKDPQTTTEFSEFWRDTVLTDCLCPATKPKWRQLLDEILRRGGYPQDY